MHSGLRPMQQFDPLKHAQLTNATLAFSGNLENKLVLSLSTELCHKILLGSPDHEIDLYLQKKILNLLVIFGGIM